MTTIVSRALETPLPARTVRGVGRPRTARRPLGAVPPLPDGTTWLAVGAVAAKGSQTAVLLVMAAVLDPAAIGVVSLAAVVLNVSAVVAGLGTATALVHHRGDAERAARTALTLALVTSLGLVALVWIVAPWVAGPLQVGQDGVDVFRGVVLCVPLIAAAAVSAELLRRGLDFRRRVLPDVVGSGVGAVVTGVALAGDAGAFAVVPGQIAQSVVVLVLMWLVRPPVVPGWSAPAARTLLSYGAGLTGGALVALVVLNVDYLLIAQRLDLEDLGVYSMAFRIAYMPYVFVAVVIGGAAFPQLCRLRGRAVGEAASRAAGAIHRILVPTYAAMIVLAPHVGLLGEEWAAAVPVLRWLAVYGLVLAAIEPLLVALRAVGRTSDTLGLAALHLVVLVVLLDRYVEDGIVAVAVVQVVAGALTLAAAVVLVTARVPGSRSSDLARSSVPVGVRSLLAAGITAAVELVQPWPEPSLLTLGILAPTFAAAFLVVRRVPDRNARRRTGTAIPARAAAAHLVAAAVAVAAGAVAVLEPTLVLAVVAGLALLVAGASAVWRAEWAAVALVVAAPFSHLLQEQVHPDSFKVLGAILFLGWAVRVLREPRPFRWPDPGLASVAAFGLVLIASFVANGADLDVGAAHLVAYVAHGLLVVVLIDLLRRRPELAAALAAAYVMACTAAGVVAIMVFLVRGGRAAGPLEDPNDLAFFLVVALPLTVVLRRGTRGRWVAVGCAAVLVVAVLATFSRGGLVGIAVMALVAALLWGLRLRTVVAVGVVVGAAVLALWVSHGEVIDQGLSEKGHVAARNVELRFETASVALEMTTDKPLLGQGPGGFAAERGRFVPDGAVEVRETVAHQMYLDLSAELGLAGLAAFLTLMILAARRAFAARGTVSERALADGVLVALAGAAATGCFLSEQLFLPVWLLAALGLGLVRPPRTRKGLR